MDLTPEEHRALTYQYDPDTYSRFSRRRLSTMDDLEDKGLVRSHPSRDATFWNDWEITRKGEEVMHALGPPAGHGGRKNLENPLSKFSLGGMTTAETVGVAVGGAAILGLIGYGIYKLVQGPQAPASYMGPGGSTTPLGPASNAAARAASYVPPVGLPGGYVQQPGDYPTGDPADPVPPFIPGVSDV